VSRDNGASWSQEMHLRGNNNSVWGINGASSYAPTFSYDGNNVSQEYQAVGNSTDSGPKNITLNNLPNSSQLKIRITFILDRTDELWAIDNVILRARYPAVSIWNGIAWSPSAPNNSTKAIINGLYNTNPNGNIEACECEVNPTFTLNVSTGTYLEIQSNLTNNGTLNVADDGSLVQVNNAAVNTGSINVTRTTSAYNKFDYTYWSSPVANPPISGPFSLWRTDYAFIFNTANYADIVAPINGFDDDNNAWSYVPPVTLMAAGKGYAIMAPTTGSFPTTSTVTFSGVPNNGVVQILLALSGNAGSAVDDFNLIGNPYPSSIRAIDFINTNLNTDGTLYFWTHRIGISGANPGPDANNFITADYAMYNLSGGTTSGLGIPAPTGFVGSGQGFFVEAQAATNVIFNNSMRNKSYINTNFYRTAVLPSQQVNLERDRVWLNLTNEAGLFSQQLLGYFEEATAGHDRGYDGLVNQSLNTVSFYSLIGEDRYRIQGKQPFAQDDLVELGYSSAIEGNFTIAIDSAEGVLSNASTNIYLEDTMLNVIHDLKASAYNFTTSIGTFNDRFLLRYTNEALATDEYLEQESIVISHNQEITIRSSEAIKMVTVFDIIGRKVFEQNNIGDKEFVISDLILARQPLIVNVLLESGESFTKKVIF